MYCLYIDNKKTSLGYDVVYFSWVTPAYKINMDINVKEHTYFINGYMDAVGRHYTDDNVLVGINAQLLESNQTIEDRLECSIKETSDVKNFAADFENSISSLLGINTQERMLFYLIEYAMWFEEYTQSCIVKKHKIIGVNVKAISNIYSLHINEKYNIFIYMFKSTKNEQKA